jgi:hypothetical protein
MRKGKGSGGLTTGKRGLAFDVVFAGARHAVPTHGHLRLRRQTPDPLQRTRTRSFIGFVDERTGPRFALAQVNASHAQPATA